MARDLLSTDGDRPGASGSKRYAVPLSIAVHILIVALVIVVPLTVTGELPSPRRAIAHFDIILPPTAPPPPPMTRAKSLTRVESIDSTAAPVEAPEGVAPETELPTRGQWDGEFGGIPGGIEGGIPHALVNSGNALPLPPPSPTQPLRVGGVIKRPRRVHDARPTYPPIALHARVQGRVVLEAIIGVTGEVREVHVVQSVPLLDEAAIRAVRQWRFTPTLLNGVPVSVIMTVDVTFTLQD